MSKIIKKLVLPSDGEVFVKKGDCIISGTLIAKTLYLRERPFIIDIAGSLKIELNEINEYLTKEIGDSIDVKEIIAIKKTLTTNYTVESPVKGILEYISPASGKIVIRERVEKEDIGPFTVNCSKELNVSPNVIRNIMKKKVGNRVEKNGIIIKYSTWQSFMEKACRSPIFGEIIDIDYDAGNVTIRRPAEIIELVSHTSGIVKNIIDNRGAYIEFEGTVIKGKFGFGGERYGILGKDIIIINKKLSRKEYDRYKDKLNGIITSSIDVGEFENIFGNDIKKGISREKKGLPTIILMTGFGDMKIDNETFNLLESNTGKYIMVDGRTQIRAGVKRPEIIIFS